MFGFFAAFAATFLLGAGARDQVLVAGLAAKLGKRASLLAAGLIATTLTIAATAWLASLIAAQVETVAVTRLAALAVGLAGLEMVVVRQRRTPTEPTRSLGAITLVLLLFQATDAVRLTTFALILTSSSPTAAAAGAALGSMAALTTGWALGEEYPTSVLARSRRGLGIAALALGGTIPLILR